MRFKKISSALLALCLLAGYGQCAALDQTTDTMDLRPTVVLEDQAVPLAAAPMPVASGTAAKTTARATIDYSNTKDGYVMVRFTVTSGKKLKAQVTGPSTTYTYDLTSGVWATFPLSQGNGNYKVTVLENTSGSKYAVEATVSFSVTLSDEFAPFLRPNQYVNYASAAKTTAKAAELTNGVAKEFDKVVKVYDFVVNNLTYDKNKAATVKSGYLPVLDSVLAAKTGICFDYAALMCGMLRSQGIPCKLVVGYAGTQYHAWISVWTKETGWVDGAIYFDGVNWQRMDPTFASSSKKSKAILQYIGHGKNYTTKYTY